MQPKIEVGRKGYDQMFYRQKIISEYIEMSKGVKEDISKYNLDAFRRGRTLMYDTFLPTLSKFAICWVIQTRLGDSTSYVQYKTIVNSLKNQRKFLKTLMGCLSRSRIKSDLYKFILTDFTTIKERCERLDSTILPELIDGTDFDLYLLYLRNKGISFSDDIADIRENDFDDDCWKDYVDNMQVIVRQYESQMSPEEKEAFEQRKKKHLNRKEMQNERNKTNQKEKREAIKESSHKEIKDKLPEFVYSELDTLLKSDVNRSPRLRLFWKYFDSKIKGNYSSSTLAGSKFYIIAKHPLNSKGFTKSGVAFYSYGGTFNKSSELPSARVFVLPLETDALHKVINKFTGERTFIDAYEVLYLEEFCKRNYEYEQTEVAKQNEKQRIRYEQAKKREEKEKKALLKKFGITLEDGTVDLVMSNGHYMTQNEYDISLLSEDELLKAYGIYTKEGFRYVYKTRDSFYTQEEYNKRECWNPDISKLNNELDKTKADIINSLNPSADDFRDIGGLLTCMLYINKYVMTFYPDSLLKLDSSTTMNYKVLSEYLGGSKLFALLDADEISKFSSSHRIREINLIASFIPVRRTKAIESVYGYVCRQIYRVPILEKYYRNICQNNIDTLIDNMTDLCGAYQDGTVDDNALAQFVAEVNNKVQL